MSQFKSRDAAPDAGAPFHEVSGTSRGDTIVKNGSTREDIDALGGNDRISSGGGSDIVRGGAGNDTINGGDGFDILRGGDDRDWLVGGAGNDTLEGDNGNDLLQGGADRDFLGGGQGNDTLVGGAGQDAMRGDEGRDVFKFNAVEESQPGSRSTDIIMDFESGADKIDLSAIDANAIVGGNQAFKYVDYDADKPLGAGQLRSHYDEFSNVTVVEGSIYGEGGSEFSINLTGNIDLSAKDFVL